MKENVVVFIHAKHELGTRAYISIFVLTNINTSTHKHIEITQ